MLGREERDGDPHLFREGRGPDVGTEQESFALNGADLRVVGDDRFDPIVFGDKVDRLGVADKFNPAALLRFGCERATDVRTGHDRFARGKEAELKLAAVNQRKEIFHLFRADDMGFDAEPFGVGRQPLDLVDALIGASDVEATDHIERVAPLFPRGERFV